LDSYTTEALEQKVVIFHRKQWGGAVLGFQVLKFLIIGFLSGFFSIIFVGKRNTEILPEKSLFLAFLTTFISIGKHRRTLFLVIAIILEKRFFVSKH